MHGANRLASNSLLEGLVFSRRIADRVAASMPSRSQAAPDPRTPGLLDSAARGELQRTMTEHAGVLRSRDGLAAGAAALERLSRRTTDVADVAGWQTTNLLTVSAALLEAAAMRTETRGSHWRDDFPDRDDQHWSGHVDVTASDGELRLSYRPATVPAGVA